MIARDWTITDQACADDDERSRQWWRTDPFAEPDYQDEPEDDDSLTDSDTREVSTAAKPTTERSNPRTGKVMTSPTVEEALKPCPFCGDAAVQMHEEPKVSTCAECRSCGARGPVWRGTSDQPFECEAVDLWNTRPLPIEAQGGEPRLEPGDVEWLQDKFARLLPDDMRSNVPQIQAEFDVWRGRIARILAALTRPGPSLGSMEAGWTMSSVMDRAGMDGRHTPGHADAYLNALLDYTGGFYSAAVASGMKASSTADAMQHVERAARGLHALALSPPSLGMDGVREALREVDEIGCPLAGGKSYDRCPKCGAKADQNCGRWVGAVSHLEKAVRQALSKPEVI